MINKSLTESEAWRNCLVLAQKAQTEHLSTWFQSDNARSARFQAEALGIHLDYSRQRVTQEIMQALFGLARAQHVPKRMQDLYEGAYVNHSEERPALHMRLRDKHDAPLLLNGITINRLIQDTLKRMETFTTAVHQGHIQGATGLPITDIVTIGMGGSHLGPLMATHALKNFKVSPLKFHFLSTPDSDALCDLFESIPAASTLFIISSKSFTTIETLSNAATIKLWLREQLGASMDVTSQFIAITAKPDKARIFGVRDAYIFPLWEWVGGRYSLWSAIGLPIMLAIGQEGFAKLLQGAYDMDRHALTAPQGQNLPELLALIDIWNINFLKIVGHAIAPYSHRLKYLIPYLQQLEMESNGKRVTQQGELVDYITSPIIFGQEGTEGQHAYHQWLHQSPLSASIDILLLAKTREASKAMQTHHHLMRASGLSQAEALAHGKRRTMHAPESLPAHQHIPGNRPSSVITLSELSPYHLGALIALYEHKTMIEGMIWNINSFDQWGVELGKELLPAILKQLQREASHENSV